MFMQKDLQKLLCNDLIKILTKAIDPNTWYYQVYARITKSNPLVIIIIL